MLFSYFPYSSAHLEKMNDISEDPVSFHCASGLLRTSLNDIFRSTFCAHNKEKILIFIILFSLWTKAGLLWLDPLYLFLVRSTHHGSFLNHHLATDYNRDLLMGTYICKQLPSYWYNKLAIFKAVLPNGSLVYTQAINVFAGPDNPAPG